MKRQREIMLLLISIFVVTVAWIAFDLYHNAVTSTISQPLQKDITPISPDFNTAVIDTLQKRQYVAPLYTASQQAAVQTATESANVTITPRPTGGLTIKETTAASLSSQTTGTVSPTP